MNSSVFTDEDVKAGKIKEFIPGDIWLGEGDSFIDWFIHLITRSKWNHAAIIVDHNGGTIELVPRFGVRKTQLIKEKERKYFIIRLHLNQQNRKNIIQFAQNKLKQKSSYDFLGLLCIFTNLVLKLPLVLKVNGSMTCSEFVADALEHGGIIWDKDPALITPKDIYDRFVLKKGDEDRFLARNWKNVK